MKIVQIKYIYLLYMINLAIIILLILVIGIFSLFLFKRKVTESFDASSYILEDCNSGLVPTNGGSCTNNAWSRNPKFFCGICGDSDINPLITAKSGNNTLFGCSQFTPNRYGLSWSKLPGQVPLNSYLSDVFTCNSYNIDANSNLFMYVCCDDKCTITVGDTVINQNGWNILGVYNFNNITYGTQVTINGTNTGGNGGICASYIWNGQLYILDNNGYTNCANIIDYSTSGNTGWSNMWMNDIYLLPPWMQNWIESQYCSSSCSVPIDLSFKVGYTKDKQNMTNDLVLFIGMNDYGTVSLNNNSVYTTSSSQANTMTQTTISNVQPNSVLKISGTSSSSSNGSLGLFYIWCGLIFSISTNNSNFNNAANIINYQTTNINGNIDPYGFLGNVQFLDYWLKVAVNTTFTLTTTINFPSAKIIPSYVYNNSVNPWVSLTQGNLVGYWKNTRIQSNSNMTISFWMNLTSLNENWSNIFQVSNQNVACCNSGNRVPGLWIEPNSTQMLLACDLNSQANTTYNFNGLVLNTPAYLTFVFQNQKVSFYKNGTLVVSYTFASPLVEAVPDAYFYLGCPWNYTGNFQIQSFSLYNEALSASDVLNLYSNNNTPKSNSSSHKKPWYAYI